MVRTLQVNVIGSEVEELATRAQADLGMDYAWLRDVTYEDWQVGFPIDLQPLT